MPAGGGREPERAARAGGRAAPRARHRSPARRAARRARGLGAARPSRLAGGGERPRAPAGLRALSSGCRASWSRTSPAPPRWRSSAWASARAASDFDPFRPAARPDRRAQARRGRVRGVRARAVRRAGGGLRARASPATILGRLFDALRRELVPLAARIADASPRPQVGVLRRAVPAGRAAALRRARGRRGGVRFQPGPARSRRPSVLHQPRRRATAASALRYDLRDFAGGVFTVLHEVGHGLYEQGLDPGHYGTPMGEAASVGMDESQARLWENRVGRSRGFWQHFFPHARERFPEAWATWTWTSSTSP